MPLRGFKLCFAPGVCGLGRVREGRACRVRALRAKDPRRPRRVALWDGPFGRHAPGISRAGPCGRDKRVPPVCCGRVATRCDRVGPDAMNCVPPVAPCRTRWSRPTAPRAEGGAGTSRAGRADATSASLPCAGIVRRNLKAAKRRLKGRLNHLKAAKRRFKGRRPA